MLTVRTAVSPLLLMAMAANVIAAEKRIGPSTEVDLLVEGNNAFAFECYQKLRPKAGSTVFCPHDVALTMGILRAGTRGEIAIVIDKAMRWKSQDEWASETFVKLNQQITNKNSKADRDYLFVIGASMWGQTGVEFDKSFAKIVSERYAGKIGHLDFRSDTAGAKKAINEWVKAMSRGRLDGLTSAEKISAQTTGVLVTTTYFKAAWKVQFPEARLKKGGFAKSDKEASDIWMMENQNSQSYLYHETEKFQAVQLSYKADASMLVLLPKKPDGLTALEHDWSVATFDTLLSNLERQKGTVAIPKFSLRSQFPIGDLLPNSVNSAFRAVNDYAGVFEKQHWHPSEFTHAVTFGINEKGTEAASVTETSDLLSASRKPFRFVADHPFLFAVYDHKTQAILYMGRYSGDIAKP